MAGEDNVDRGDDFTPTLDDVKDDLPQDTLNSDTSVDNDVKDEVKDNATDEQRAEEKPRDDKGKFIPKARFDEALRKERDKAEAAQREAAELQKQLQSVNKDAKVVDLEKQLDDLRDKQNEALLDGNKEQARELGRQADRINRQIMIAESQTLSTQAAEEARESIRVETAIERLEEIYPALKEDSETYDQDLVDLVLAKQQQLINRDKMSASQALTKAANDIMTRMQPAAKVDDEKPAGGLAGAKGTKVTERATTGKQKAVDAALKTPPDTRDVGIDTDKAGMKDGLPTPMSVDDLKAIPEATLKRMRGDLA